MSTQTQARARAHAEVFNRQRKVRVSRRAIAKLTQAIARELGRTDTIHVTLLDDAQMSELNQRVFGKNRPTNVISLPLGGGPGVEAFLGDIVVSVDTALAEARAADLPVSERLAQLIIHGYLHLVGYEHVGVSAAERQRMKRAERRVFAAVHHLTTGLLED